MHALTLVVEAADVDAAAAMLDEALGALAVTIEDADAGSPAEQAVFDEPGVDGASTWRRGLVSALFADEDGALRAAAALAARAGASIRIDSIRPVADEDWVRLTQAQFAPAEIGDGVWIVPSWAEVPPPARLPIRLDPGRAFGTGTHPTTRMCLRRLVRRPPLGLRVLDYGCGSGVLAIAAALLGAADVLAVDIDPVAVETADANARANEARAVRVGTVDEAAGSFDVVVANILAAPLKLLAPLLAARVAGGGEIVLSGILERQIDELRAAYAPWLALEVADRDDGWVLLTGRAGPCMA